MLIPRFSVRLLLVATLLCSCYARILLLAREGYSWAIALAIAGASLVVLLGIHTFVFSLAWSIASFFRLGIARPRATSPFASGTPPPQHVVPPEDTE